MRIGRGGCYLRNYSFQMAARHNRINPKNGNWKGRMTLRTLHALIHDADGPLLIPMINMQSRTVKKFADEDARLGDVYLVYVPGHFFLLKNGRLLDQSGVRAYDKTRFKRSRINYVYRVGPSNDTI